MQLGITAKYAIQILSFMAQNKSNKYSSKQLSEELKIPYKYLTKIMTKLTKKDMVQSAQGRFGGFSIIKKLEDIRIIDIVIIFDDIDNKRCVLADMKCDFEQKCIVHDKWQKPRCAIDNFFEDTTLLDLLENDSNSIKI